MKQIKEKIQVNHQQIAAIEKELINGNIPMHCIRALDQTLESLGVCRQAYHSQSFVGNHCHKLLKVYLNLKKKIKHVKG